MVPYLARTILYDNTCTRCVYCTSILVAYTRIGSVLPQLALRVFTWLVDEKYFSTMFDIRHTRVQTDREYRYV